MPPVIRAGRVPGGVPRFLAQAPSIPIPPGTFLPPVTGTVGGVADPNTVLLVHADGTNGSTTFTDASSYAKTLTTLGTAQVTTTSTKFGSGSANFNNDASAGIDVGFSSDYDFLHAPYTIEAWIYQTSKPSVTFYTIMAAWGGDPNSSWWMGLSDSNQFTFLRSMTGSYNPGQDLRYQPNFSTNTWYHVAVDFDGTVVRGYVDGAVVFSQGETNPLFTPTVSTEIGSYHGSTGAFPGYIDEVRITKGIARYAGTFTPPTAPFVVSVPLIQDNQTLAAGGTVAAGPVIGGIGIPIPSPSCVLLMHADGTAGSTTFVDASPSAHALTPTSVTVNATNKFGSGAADFTVGISSAIDTGNATDFNFGAAPFTIEMWAYYTNATGASYLASQFGTSGNQGWAFSTTTPFVNLNLTSDGTNFTQISGTYSFVASTWYHLAADRDASGTVRLYVNGAVVGSGSFTAAVFPSTLTAIIGNNHGGTVAFKGYLDEIRVTKGRAMYAGAFTPPAQPFSVSNTVLLIHADGTNGSTAFIDSSLSANTLTAVGTAQIGTANPYFGTGSLDLHNSAASWLDINNATDFNFGSGPFTIEAWVYITASPAAAVILSHWGTQFSVLLSFDNSTITFQYSSDGSTGVNINTSYTPPHNAWFHLAVDRDATNTLRVYSNGVVLNSQSFAVTLFPLIDTTLVGNFSPGFLFPGQLDEIRVSKGVARFAGAFTPPTTAYLPDFTIGITQDAQTLSAAGTVAAAGAVTGDLTQTQANQTLAATGTVSVTGTLGVTEALDTIVAAGVDSIVGTLNATEALDTLAATATVQVRGTLILTEALDTIVAAGADSIVGTLNQPQASHTLVAAGNVAALSAVTGTLNVTQADQTISATATLVVSGTLTRVQADHTLAATGGLALVATLSVLQANQTLAATAVVGETASLSLTQANQTLVATGGLTVGGALSLIQASQTLAANTNVAALPQTRVVIMA